MLYDFIVKKRFFRIFWLTAFTAALIMAAACISPAFSQDAGQKAFKSPQAAFKALLAAARSNNTKELLAIFGPEGKDLISSGDAVADTRGRERFVKLASEKTAYSRLDGNTTLAIIGKDAWCFPIPISRSGKGWFFSTQEGKEEILNRRIGRNELNAIQVSLAYVNAQREYFAKERNGGGVRQYAQHFISQPGKKDGLYWEAAPDEEKSPLGPLFARATGEGYSFGANDHRPSPYYGYYFRILKAQGKSAAGGALDYVVNGKMVNGFGLVAYPAHYGVSGIMTMIVNNQGVVFQKDLGPKTEEAAKAIAEYDPDETWKRTGPAGE